MSTIAEINIMRNRGPAARPVPDLPAASAEYIRELVRALHPSAPLDESWAEASLGRVQRVANYELRHTVRDAIVRAAAREGLMPGFPWLDNAADAGGPDGETFYTVDEPSDYFWSAERAYMLLAAAEYASVRASKAEDPDDVDDWSASATRHCLDLRRLLEQAATAYAVHEYGYSKTWTFDDESEFLCELGRAEVVEYSVHDGEPLRSRLRF